jgi:regulator of cell morphogenesis and NO signaling
MNERFEHATVGEIVAMDFRAADLFERFGIDFCCGGRRTLEDACRQASVDPMIVRHELETLPRCPSDQDDVRAWSPDRLIDHIVSRHHVYVRAALPTISRQLETLEQVHGERHPELARVRVCFERMRQDLLRHMQKEEQVVFPYLHELAACHAGRAVADCPFGTVGNPTRMLEREHREAAAELRVIRELTAGFSAPADGCTTYSACMAELARFERDLHRHMHLENNVLFPEAVELERGVWHA